MEMSSNASLHTHKPPSEFRFHPCIEKATKYTVLYPSQNFALLLHAQSINQSLIGKEISINRLAEYENGGSGMKRLSTALPSSCSIHPSSLRETEKERGLMLLSQPLLPPFLCLHLP
uniref:Uncharacterized protein n=1 Tax=Setaria italica TaxID=4555 RepID=K3Y033_SETIT